MNRAVISIRHAALAAIAIAMDPYPETRPVDLAPKPAPAPPEPEPWGDSLTGEWGNRAARRRAKRRGRR